MRQGQSIPATGLEASETDELRQALSAIVQVLAGYPEGKPLDADILDRLRSLGPVPTPNGPAASDVNVQALIARLNQALAIMPVMAGVGTLDAEWIEVLGGEIRDLAHRLDQHDAAATGEQDKSETASDAPHQLPDTANAEHRPPGNQDLATPRSDVADPDSKKDDASGERMAETDEPEDVSEIGLSPADLSPAPWPGGKTAQDLIEEPILESESGDQPPSSPMQEPISSKDEADSQASGEAQLASSGDPTSPSQTQPAVPFSGPIPAILRKGPDKQTDSAAAQNQTRSTASETIEGESNEVEAISIPEPKSRPLSPLPDGERRARWQAYAVMLALIFLAFAATSFILNSRTPNEGSIPPLELPTPPTTEKVLARAEPNPPAELVDPGANSISPGESIEQEAPVRLIEPVPAPQDIQPQEANETTTATEPGPVEEPERQQPERQETSSNTNRGVNIAASCRNTSPARPRRAPPPSAGAPVSRTFVNATVIPVTIRRPTGQLPFRRTSTKLLARLPDVVPV